MANSKLKNSDRLNIISSPEAIALGEYVVVDYRISVIGDTSIEDAAVLLALTTSVGTVPALNYEKRPERERVTGKVVTINKGDTVHHVRIAYPLALCEPGSGLTQLVSVISFAAEYDFISSLWVEDISCPHQYLAEFPGPRWGIHDIRHRFGVPKRPLLGVIVKPRAGANLESLAQILYEALIGGADFIIDDELVTNPAGELAAANRIPKFIEVAEKASQKSGQCKVYIANASASPARARNLALFAQAEGAAGILLNGYSMGLSALEDLSGSGEISIPIFTSNMGSAMLTRSHAASGMSELVIAKLSRIAGADGVYSGIGSSSWYSHEVFRHSLAALRGPMYNYRPTFPIVCGGLSPLNLLDNLCLQGEDIVVQAGSSILRHPSGPKEGATAFRLIIDQYNPANDPNDNVRTLIGLGKQHKCVSEVLTALNFTGQITN